MSYYATEKGIRNLSEEIARLTKKSRELESKTTETAQNCGDNWHDNPGLYALNDEADMQAKHINELSDILSNCQRITYPEKVTQVCVGSRVTVNINGCTECYDIVGYGESDPERNKILYGAPLARELITKKENESFTFKIAGEKREAKILKVEPIQDL